MSNVFLNILVVLVAAKLAAELAERINVPTVAAEIVAGILIGPSVLGLVKHGIGTTSGPPEVLSVLGEIGVILLLLEVGMQMDLRELKAVGRASMTVAVIGVIAPMSVGLFACQLLGMTTNQSLFAASALAATSVGITARVFGDLRALATIEARTVLGAAVADDVIGLVILTVVVRLAAGSGGISAASLAKIIAIALGFLVVTSVLGVLGAPKIFALIDRSAKSTGTLFALALAFTLGLAQLASLAKLAPIIGAFVAGLSLGRSSSAARIQRELTPVGHLFIPVFFLEIGIQTDARAFLHGKVLEIAAVLTVVAISGKLVAGIGATGMKADRLFIGIGMIPRGEVGLIFAGIGLREAILTDNIYASILLMVLVTTLITPPLLALRYRVLAKRRPADHLVSSLAEPAEGWIASTAGRMLELRQTPPTALALGISLDIASRLDEATPSNDLLMWVARSADAGKLQSQWTEMSTALFVRQIAHGSTRAWRFLETTGVLENSLPELTPVLRQRRAASSVLEGAGVSPWPVVERFRSLVDGVQIHTAAEQRAHAIARRLDRPAPVYIASFLIDSVSDQPASSHVAQSLLDRLRLTEDDRTLVAGLVADAGLLRGAALRPEGLTEDSVLRVAAHLRTRERMDALFVLTLAQNALELWEERLIDEFHRVLVDCLGIDGVGEERTSSVVDRNRDAALELAGRRPHIADRISAAPLAYLISESPEAIARHANLLEPVPARSRFRVNVHAEEMDVWRVEITTRDQLGLLAITTGVLEQAGLDVQDAVLATWGDGAALQAFRVKSELIGMVPDPAAIERALPKAATVLLGALPAPDAEVSFDDVASPWHTLAEVHATDRRGLLHALAVAFAVAGADVHAASITTNEAMAFDRFDLTDRNGRKLDADMKAAIRDALQFGVRGELRRGGLFGWANKVATISKHSGDS